MAAEDYELVHAETRAEWRRWLAANHASAPAVWLVSWKKPTGKPAVGYDAAVEEALCFGWIDSVRRTGSLRKVTVRQEPGIISGRLAE